MLISVVGRGVVYNYQYVLLCGYLSVLCLYFILYYFMLFNFVCDCHEFSSVYFCIILFYTTTLSFAIRQLPSDKNTCYFLCRSCLEPFYPRYPHPYRGLEPGFLLYNPLPPYHRSVAEPGLLFPFFQAGPECSDVLLGSVKNGRY